MAYKLNGLLASLVVVVLVMTAVPATVQAAPCLASGDPTVVQGASVATFESLGVNPAVTCIENSLWTDPAGFTLGSFVTGANGLGGTPNPNVLDFNGASVDGTFAGNANARDFFWVQDTGNTIVFPGSPDLIGPITGGRPSQGLIWDLGGPANQAVVFVQVDHGPLPGEVLENTAWLGTSADTTNDSAWTQALLDHVYLQGWSPTLSHIADGFVAVYRLPGGATFQFVSVTHGGPGAVHRDADNEIDAVGGLNVTGGCVTCPIDGVIPEPATLLLLGSGLAGLFALRYRKQI